MKYVRIYTGPDGETHCEDLEMETTLAELTANVPPVTISQTFPSNDGAKSRANRLS